VCNRTSSRSAMSRLLEMHCEERVEGDWEGKKGGKLVLAKRVKVNRGKV
jgi:hypothetical protein